ncbi:unnamed protein product, partial [Allacma fusca]
SNEVVSCLLHYIENNIPEMPIDSDFGLIERAKRRCKQMVFPQDITELVKRAKITNPNEIVYVNNCFTNDLCDDGTPVVTVKNYKAALEPLFSSKVLVEWTSVQSEN